MTTINNLVIIELDSGIGFGGYAAGSALGGIALGAARAMRKKKPPPTSISQIRGRPGTIRERTPSGSYITRYRVRGEHCE